MPENTTVIQQAMQANQALFLSLAAANVPVFPVWTVDTPWTDKDGTPKVHKAKSPCTTKGFKDATCRPDIIKGWIRRWPNAAPGMPTGPTSGLSVIDVDPLPDGRDWRAALVACKADPAEASIVVATPRGGWHIIYAHAHDVRNSQTIIAPGVDVRGDGGYIVAPGAIMHNGSYRVIQGDFATAIMGVAPDFPDLPQLAVGEHDPATSIAPADVDRADLKRALHHIPADLAYGEWVKVLAGLHHATGGDAWGKAQAHAWSADDPRYESAQVDSKWRSFGATEHAPVTAASLYALARDHGYQAVTADAFDDDSPQDSAPVASRLTFLKPGDCADLPARDYVVKGLISPRQIGCIFGDPGAGKSLLAPRIAYAIAQGLPAFGLRTRPGPVFYVACEDESGMAGRIAALHADLGDADGFRLVTGCSDLFSPGQIDGRGSRDLEALRAAVKADRPSLILIDTLAMAMPGMEENDAGGMNRVVQIGKVLARHGAAVVFVHHGTKAEGNTPRGHSVFNGALDFSIQVKRDDSTGIVRGMLRKNRNGPSDLDMAFRIGARRVGTDIDGEPVMAPICEPCDPLEGQASERLKPTERAALDLIKTMAGGTGQVDDTAFRTAAIDCIAITASENRDNRRRTVSAALKGLAHRGMIQVTDGVIQVTDVSRLIGIFQGFDDE